MKNVRLAGTTSAGGALTVNGETAINGLLHAIDVNLSACDACTCTITTQGADAALTLMTLTSSQLNSTIYPRASSCGLTGTVGTDQLLMLPLVGTPRVVISGGGNAKAAQITLYYIEA